MQSQFLHGLLEASIPVSIGNHRGQILLECREAGAFLRAVETINSSSTFSFRPEQLGEDCYLRGVILPGQGASFQVFDSLGTVSHEILTLSDMEAQRLLLNIW